METLKAILSLSRGVASAEALLLGRISQLLPAAVRIRSLRAGTLLLECPAPLQFQYQFEVATWLQRCQGLPGGGVVTSIVWRKR